ncbi:hypothetical protein M378DRAFT_163098 [Amanita muscaria Koide BX008]|uniref:Uncharacterized protein n=1 Tax=Amanita muscaria (strain Koide BX008) TaxID=946122 RepID=A0A0C2WSG7_AMAMK|nr:hypothetical protein M378DRAFT_163098 [Amanita muscaria Koide BX008]
MRRLRKRTPIFSSILSSSIKVLLFRSCPAAPDSACGSLVAGVFPSVCLRERESNTGKTAEDGNAEYQRAIPSFASISQTSETTPPNVEKFPASSMQAIAVSVKPTEATFRVVNYILIVKFPFGTDKIASQMSSASSATVKFSSPTSASAPVPESSGSET